MSRVDTQIRDHVAHVTLTRADKMNAVDPEMAEAIVAAGEALKGNEEIRAVLLSAEGKGFCAGLDVASFGQHASGGDQTDRIVARTHGPSNLMQQVAMVWREVPVPVIAAVHGVAFGAGFQLALGADVRIAAPGTKFAVMEAKWGLVPDMGGMVLMPKLMRSDVIRLMTYTAEPVSAEKGVDWGFVTEIAEDPHARALEIVTNIAQKSPSGTRLAKSLIAVAESNASEAEVLMAESVEQAKLIGGKHQQEIVRANMQKRAPNF
ncbi:crotonase/enoyl-CoA hydratase family protein [Pseudooceanicola nitratireducens]|uniref:crotonase/enoyl-CoA hydratase family protein n=1 Tax=Pseudooceanicola nitratireducens TaxID=517719 RepID=UPI003C7C402A